MHIVSTPDIDTECLSSVAADGKRAARLDRIDPDPVLVDLFDGPTRIVDTSAPLRPCDLGLTT